MYNSIQSTSGSPMPTIAIKLKLILILAPFFAVADQRDQDPPVAHYPLKDVATYPDPDPDPNTTLILLTLTVILKRRKTHLF